MTRPVVWISVVYSAAVLFSVVSYLHGDSKQSLVMLLLVALGPLAIYGCARFPLIFPFCAYILVLPFDSLSSLGSGGTLAKLLGVLSAGALLVRLLSGRHPIRPPKAVFAWLALLVWMLWSMLWAINLRDATGTFQIYASLIALYTLLAVVPITGTEMKFVLASVVAAGSISAGYDSYLYHTGQSLVTANVGVSRVIISAGDASIDPNSLAAALVLPAAIALYYLFNARRVVLTIIMIPTLTIILLGFSASGSRGGFIELAVLFIYLIARSRHRVWLATLMVLAAVTTLLANPGLPARFADAQQDGAAGRRDIWNIGVHALRDYWFAGAGIGNFPNAFDNEYIKVYAQYVLGWHWPAHNVPLQLATELGVIGASIFAVAVVLQFRILDKFGGHDYRAFELRLALEGAFVGIMVSGFSTSNLNSKYVWLSFSVMALYRGLLRNADQKSALGVSAPPQVRHQAFQGRGQKIVPVAVKPASAK